MSLGQSLRRLRKNKGITLARLAEEVGSHVGNLSRIERDSAKPSLDLLYKIAEALDYQLADIFQEADSQYASRRQSALNTLFISLVDQDQELLLEFAELLQRRQQKKLVEVEVSLRKQPTQTTDELEK
ncbi:helix-turn-helix domain-containing protein [Marinospirillum sp.]|uniref:helix-turn-helix domain-containing protein n=1 Tax=Marinospirillum sp. TaxID=2183934 RepID=UPI00384BDAC6